MLAMATTWCPCPPLGKSSSDRTVRSSAGPHDINSMIILAWLCSREIPWGPVKPVIPLGCTVNWANCTAMNQLKAREGGGAVQEIGPYEIGWKPRKHSWAEAANLLFIDNPVGTGWSHVDKHGSFGGHLTAWMYEDTQPVPC